MKVFFLSATQGGLEAARIYAHHHPVAGYIGLTEERDNSLVSGFSAGREFCERAGIPYFEAGSYTLDSDADRALFASLDIDVLIVSGWQRLVPPAVINACGTVLGVHGSPLGISRGRGRSPQNWALIKGWDTFELSIFRISPGIDDGEVLATASFGYNLRDDIHSSYLKTSYLTARLLVSLADEGRLGAAGIPQEETAARYLPARAPEDGAVDWRLSAAELVDFIRALTRPYPGAFTTFGGRRVVLWDAVAFEAGPTLPDEAPGTLLHRYAGGELLIRCGTGAIIVRDHDLDPSIVVPLRFHSSDHLERLRTIIERHQNKYPSLPIAEDLLEVRR